MWLERWAIVVKVWSRRPLVVVPELRFLVVGPIGRRKHAVGALDEKTMRGIVLGGKT